MRSSIYSLVLYLCAVSYVKIKVMNEDELRERILMRGHFAQQESVLVAAYNP